MKRLALLAVLASLCLAQPAQAKQWPTWGNTTITDCTFAAAADWELGALGHEANEAQIIKEFHEAGGSDDEGLLIGLWTDYWQHHGIGGVKARPVEEQTISLWSSHSVRWQRHRLGVVLARAHFLIGLVNLGGEFHVLLVVGVDPHGVRIVSWGTESTVSWLWWKQALVTTYVVRLVE